MWSSPGGQEAHTRGVLPEVTSSNTERHHPPFSAQTPSGESLIGKCRENDAKEGTETHAGWGNTHFT